jgi:chemotaxis protein methyltransferase CheR
VKPAVGASDVERFRDALGVRLGLLFDDTKLAFLAETLERRLAALDVAGVRYLERLEGAQPLGEERRALVEELTVPETYFFRNVEQLRAYAEVALPDRLAARGPGQQLRVLSAGCASGEEAYSLAIFTRERLGRAASRVSIRAVDVNPAMLERAAHAHYSEWSLRDTPADMRRRWFRVEDREFILDAGVKAAVKFDERNLADDDADLWPPEAYDVVFCRNVIMYFTPELAQALIERIARAVAPGGYLFLGHVEQVHGRTPDFHLRHTHGTFYYQRKRPGETESEPLPAEAEAEAEAEADAEAVAVAVVPDTGGEAPIERDSAGPTAPADVIPADLGAAEELLREERFAEALELTDALSREDPRVLVLRAVLLFQGGQLDAAERACRAALERDHANAGAYYLWGLCRDVAGDRAGAIERHRSAVFLDPAFAMPRLHLGLLARRAGDAATARRELGHALQLLHGEDASRLLLYGSGFRRDALISWCEAELAGVGGIS